MKKAAFFLGFLLVIPWPGLIASQAEDPMDPGPIILTLDRWLLAGPLDAPAPLFSADPNAASILSQTHLALDRLRPGAADPIDWPGSARPTVWKAIELEGNSLLLPGAEEGALDKTFRIAYLAGYLECRERGKVKVRIRSMQAFDLYCDGARSGGGMTAKEDKEPKEVLIDLDLRAGKHCLAVKSVHFGQSEDQPWVIEAAVEIPAESRLESACWSIDPRSSFASLEDLTEMTRVGAIALSPDGGLLAMQLAGFTGSEHKRTSWIEIRSTRTGEKLYTTQPGNGARSPQWSKNGKLLAFQSGASIHLLDWETKEIREAVREEKGLGSYFWSPDSRFLYYLKSEEKKDDGGYYRVRDPRYRLTDWDEEARLWIGSLDGKVRRVLTGAGEFAVTAAAPSPDGSRLALVRRLPRTGRPYFETEFWIMDLAAASGRRVKTADFPFENGPAHLTWSPDGRVIAFTAPPAETRGEGPQINAFDTCLYLLDPEAETLVRLSDRFNEAVAGDGLWWSPRDGKIYFIAQHRAFARIGRIDPFREGGIELLTDTPSVITRMACAEGSDLLAFSGSSIDQPERVFLFDPKLGPPEPFHDPNQEFMARKILGRWERFPLENPDGYPLDGWIFYPPGFKEEGSHPLVVYYYGGVAPEVEEFSVLYYHWFAANGYVVFVINPSGAVGYGRDFANLHVNDWGELAGRDILDGVEKVLAAKPFLDRERIGCYGGSFGGFMTLSLISRTDLFKAACSMYGISNLASYWGGGIWGYTYGDTAMAGSYPWNRPDLFLERSPLFQADRIRTALLLLHGEADVNVPALESDQIFTALKVLGREAAYVRFPGEDHGIAGKFENLLAHRRMILEWFDMHLKDRPEAWEDRWREKSTE